VFFGTALGGTGIATTATASLATTPARFEMRTRKEPLVAGTVRVGPVVVLARVSLSWANVKAG
jgi:hypothetical protein